MMKETKFKWCLIKKANKFFQKYSFKNCNKKRNRKIKNIRKVNKQIVRHNKALIKKKVTIMIKSKIKFLHFNLIKTKSLIKMH